MSLAIASITGIDRHALVWIVDHRISFLNPVFKGLTLIATGGTVWVVLAVLLAWRTSRPIVPVGVLAAVAVWGADGVSHLLKVVTNRPRPFLAMPHLHLLISRPTSNSFPSSHATTAFAGAAVLSYLWPRWWPAFAAAAALVAYSRLYVGVHYPTDVLAGAAIGALVAGAVILVVKRTPLGARLARRTAKGVVWL